MMSGACLTLIGQAPREAYDENKDPTICFYSVHAQPVACFWNRRIAAWFTGG